VVAEEVVERERERKERTDYGEKKTRKGG